jgi:hypothetical protein
MRLFGVVLTMAGIFVFESYQSEIKYGVVIRITQKGLTYGKKFNIIFIYWY